MCRHGLCMYIVCVCLVYVNMGCVYMMGYMCIWAVCTWFCNLSSKQLSRKIHRGYITSAKAFEVIGPTPFLYKWTNRVSERGLGIPHQLAPTQTPSKLETGPSKGLVAAREEIGLGWELSWSPQVPRDSGTGPYSYSLGGSLTGSPSPLSNVGGWLGPWGPQLMYSWGTSPPLGMPSKLLSILFLSISREGTPPPGQPKASQGAPPPRGRGPVW